MDTGEGQTVFLSPQSDSTEQVSHAKQTPSFLDNASEDDRHGRGEAVECQNHVESATTNCPFLDKIPAEIRNRIYELLLVNPDLATGSSISKDTFYGREAAYDLAPNLLGTCKQINAEATYYLYEKNTFIMALGIDRFYTNHGSLNPSPLTRYGIRGTRSAFSRVRHWKIALSLVNRDHDSYPLTTLSRFCRKICYSPPKSMEVLLIPVGYEVPSTHPRYNDVQKSLSPFRSIRNLEKFCIRDLTKSEVPGVFRRDPRLFNLQNHMDGQTTFNAELRELV